MRAITGLALILFLLDLPAYAQSTSATVNFASSALSASSTAVNSGGTITTGARATSSSSADTINYSWGASCAGGLANGSFATPNNYGTTWTAPSNSTGSYQICTLTLLASATPSGASASLSESITVRTQSSSSTTTIDHPINGWWWSSTVPGIGFSIEVDASGKMFMGAYMYDSSGNPVWYVANLTAQSSAGIPAGGVFGGGGSSSAASPFPEWTGTLQYYTGGPALGAAYQAAKASNIGPVSLSCTTSIHCALTLPNVTSPLAIERYAFVSGGASRNVASASLMPQTGWWWNPSQAGLGYFVEVQSDSSGNNTAFIAYYLYDQSGNPRWFITYGAASSSGGVFGSGGTTATSANAVQCSGGASLGNLVPTPIQCSAMASGQIQDSFASTTSGSVNYENDNLTIAIQRLSF